ncbi:MFS transporter [Actinomadura madurae]|uniref:MFS transporter n=1 Tax=Actinomadura madurae TaxID=1993 RepID=UPI001C4334BC|nr:MFS transporter [Actinomadura madurae]
MQRRNVRTAAASGFFGTTLEYYDFLIYGTAAALFFGEVFFPDPSLGTLLALGTFGVAYVARPFGAVLWGHLGDKVGRKKILLAILLTMGIATFLVGCLPSYAAVGATAPVLLVVLRVIQGLSAGGEQAGSALIAFEHAPDRRRAWYTSWTQSGSQFGNFVASVVFLPLTALLSKDAMLAWGWRIPFWASALVIALTFVLRRRLVEPEVGGRRAPDASTVKVPLVEVFRGHWRAVLRVVVSGLCLTPAGMVYVFGLSYGTNVIGLSRSLMLILVAGSALGMSITIPVFAMLSDRIGRKPVFLIGLAGCAALIPLWLGAVHAGEWPVIYLAGFVLMDIFLAMTTAILLAAFLEMFPAHIRFSGMAVSFMISIVLTGLLPVIAQSLVHNDPDNWGQVAWLFAGLLGAAAVAVLAGPETHRVPTLQLGITGTGRAKPEARGAGTRTATEVQASPVEPPPA